MRLGLVIIMTSNIKPELEFLDDALALARLIAENYPESFAHNDLSLDEVEHISTLIDDPDSPATPVYFSIREIETIKKLESLIQSVRLDLLMQDQISGKRSRSLGHLPVSIGRFGSLAEYKQTLLKKMGQYVKVQLEKTPVTEGKFPWSKLKKPRPDLIDYFQVAYPDAHFSANRAHPPINVEQIIFEGMTGAYLSGDVDLLSVKNSITEAVRSKKYSVALLGQLFVCWYRRCLAMWQLGEGDFTNAVESMHQASVELEKIFSLLSYANEEMKMESVEDFFSSMIRHESYDRFVSALCQKWGLITSSLIEIKRKSEDADFLANELNGAVSPQDRAGCLNRGLVCHLETAKLYAGISRQDLMKKELSLARKKIEEIRALFKQYEDPEIKADLDLVALDYKSQFVELFRESQPSLPQAPIFDSMNDFDMPTLVENILGGSFHLERHGPVGYGLYFATDTDRDLSFVFKYVIRTSTLQIAPYNKEENSLVARPIDATLGKDMALLFLKRFNLAQYRHKFEGRILNYSFHFSVRATGEKPDETEEIKMKWHVSRHSPEVLFNPAAGALMMDGEEIAHYETPDPVKQKDPLPDELRRDLISRIFSKQQTIGLAENDEHDYFIIGEDQNYFVKFGADGVFKIDMKIEKRGFARLFLARLFNNDYYGQDVSGLFDVINQNLNHDLMKDIHHLSITAPPEPYQKLRDIFGLKVNRKNYRSVRSQGQYFEFVPHSKKMLPSSTTSLAVGASSQKSPLMKKIGTSLKSLVSGLRSRIKFFK